MPDHAPAELQESQRSRAKEFPIQEGVEDAPLRLAAPESKMAPEQTDVVAQQLQEAPVA